MKYLVQTENITEEKEKIVDCDRVVLDTTDDSVYLISGDGYNLVDLGLPSGTLWMDRNIGAKEITDNGLYFAWGETEGYSGITADKRFTWDDYKYANGACNKLTKYCNNSDHGNDGFTDNLTELELSDDAAYAYTNGKCKMPTRIQLQELIDGTTYTWTAKDGVGGVLFVSRTNSNSIFLPDTKIYRDGKKHEFYSLYWTNNLSWYKDYCFLSHCYYFYNGDEGSTEEYDRCYGSPIRGVKV
jgi:hypothetical protein